MSTVTENDLKELKTLIENQGKELNQKLERITENINYLRVDIATLKSEVNNNNKRLDNIDFIIRTIFVGIVITLLLGVFKYLYPLIPNA